MAAKAPPENEDFYHMTNSQKEKFKHKLLDGISKNHDQFADVIITVEDQKFKCHKMILALMSPYFHSMFAMGFRETESKTLNLPTITARAFTLLKSYMYTGNCSISVEIAQELLVGAAILQLEELQIDCEKMLEPSIDIGNCLSWFKFARSYNCKILLRKCRTYIMDGGCEVWNDEEFMDFELEDLESVVNQDQLVIAEEEQVCDAILRWIEMEKDSREKYAGRLLRHVRLCRVQPEYLIQCLFSHPVLANDADCKSYLEEVRNYFLLPARRNEFSSERFWLRHSDDFEQVILALTEPDLVRSDPANLSSKPVWAFSHVKKSWFTLNKVEDTGNALNAQGEGMTKYSMLSYDNCVFVGGGALANTKTLLKYNNLRTDWEPASTDKDKMRKGRTNFSMVAVGSSIFVIGGSFVKTIRPTGCIEEFKILSSQWEQFADLKEPVSEAPTVAIGTNVYVFGGLARNGKYFSGLQVLNTRKKDVQSFDGILENVHQPCHVLTVDGQISIFDSNGFVFDFFHDKKGPRIEFIMQLHIPKEILPICCVTHYRGQYVIISGKPQNPNFYNKLFTVDLRNKSSKKVKEINLEGGKYPKYIHTCVNAIVKGDALYHTFFQ